VYNSKTPLGAPRPVINKSIKFEVTELLINKSILLLAASDLMNNGIVLLSIPESGP
jgi:hypothetical protein